MATSTVSAPTPPSKDSQLAPELMLRMHELMLKARVLEERLITMYRQGDGYFWIGGPGEEAFNVPLGMLVHKGIGPQHDYLHLHYRSSATLLALGADPVDALRQMKNVASDPYSGGRNFCGHYAVRDWNVVPVSSPIEVQYSMAPGTALANKRAGGKGITIVTGGDAGTAEADFATCLVWSSRRGAELPVLILVTNNRWGISTPYDGQHGEERIADRGKAFGMPTVTVDGNDPEQAYAALKTAMDYVRRERRPYLVEALVSRLNGHSSASGANFVKDESDCLAEMERRMETRKLRTRAEMDEMRARFTAELLEASKKVCQEAPPDGADIHKWVFAERDVVGEAIAAKGGA